jgi:hypothetical protein
MKSKIVTAILVLIVSLGSATGTEAQSPSATLSSGSGSGMAGDTGISIPVSLNSNFGAQVSGLNFDLTYDNNRLDVISVTTGPAAAAANKGVSTGSIDNMPIKVIIAGLNQDVIPDGIVAYVNINVLPSANPGASSLALSNAAASDPGGAGVALSLSNGSFTVIAPTSTPLPPPSNTPVPPNTHTPTATQVPSGGPTQTSTLPATNTSSAPGFASPTLTPTLISTSENTPFFTPTVDMTASSTLEMDTVPTSDEVVSKEMAQSIEMSIMATMTALADVDAQVAATGTALALSAGGGDAATGDSASEGGLLFSNPLMWPAIIGISAGAIALSIFGARVVRKRRGSR